MDSEQDNAFASTPPVEAGPLGTDETVSGWPKVIGIISLIYALCGLLCAAGVGASSFFTESMMKLAGMDIVMPQPMKINGVISAILMLIAGIILLTGSVNLLRRQRLGVKLLKIWAVFRIVMVLIGTVVAVWIAPSQIAFQRSMEDAQREQMAKSGRKYPLPEKTDAQIWKQLMITTAIVSTLFVAYPIFLGFYLSRRTIDAEVQQWP